jgi:hypothetical protein
VGSGRPTAFDLLSEHSEPYSETWPTSGMTRNGQAYELPTQEPHTAASASSSSPNLPTPTGAVQHPDPNYVNREKAGIGSRPSCQRLPTPHTSASTGAGLHGTGGPNLQTVVGLIPTPTGAARERRLGALGTDTTMTAPGGIALPSIGASTTQQSAAGNTSPDD